MKKQLPQLFCVKLHYTYGFIRDRLKRLQSVKQMQRDDVQLSFRDGHRQTHMLHQVLEGYLGLSKTLV